MKILQRNSSRNYKKKDFEFERNHNLNKTQGPNALPKKRLKSQGSFTVRDNKSQNMSTKDNSESKINNRFINSNSTANINRNDGQNH